MLSATPIKSAESASHYFAGTDNYYTKDEEGLSMSEWWGEGAKRLGLEGQVEAKTFDALLKGLLPSGQLLGRIKEGVRQHRAGSDLTFHVPKSVSIAALLGGDTRLFQLTLKAAKETLAYIEAEYASARKTEKGETVYEKTDNLTAGLFLHDISREADPQLHVHAVVLNITQRADHEWRALASQSRRYDKEAKAPVEGFLEKVRHHKLYLGLVFRNQLAFHLKEAGYDLDKKSNGFFELKGLSSEVLKAYSTRRNQIETYLKDRPNATQKETDMATLATRKRKISYSREALDTLWASRAALHKVDAVGEARTVVEKSQARLIENAERDALTTAIGEQESKAMSMANTDSPIQRPTLTSEQQEAERAFAKALTHLSSTQLVVNEEQVMTEAMGFSMTAVSIGVLSHEFQTCFERKDLIPLREGEQQGLFLIQKGVEVERTFHIRCQARTEGEISWVSKERFEAWQARPSSLLPLDEQALSALARNEHQLTWLSNMTTENRARVLPHLTSLLQSGGYRPLFLTATRLNVRANKVLLQSRQESLKEVWLNLWREPRVETTAAFLASRGVRLPQERFRGQPVVVVLEAHQHSLLELEALSKTATQQGARLLLCGDERALAKPHQPQSMQWAMQHGASFIRVESIREKRELPLASASAPLGQKIHLLSNEAKEALCSKTVEIKEVEARQNQMVSHFLALPESTQLRSSLVLAHRKTADRLNQFVHEQRRAMQDNTAPKLTLETLQPVFLNELQKQSVHHYQVGQVLRFEKGFSERGLKPSEYVTLIRIDKAGHQLHLMREKGQLLQWNPSTLDATTQQMEVYQPKRIAITEGELLILRRANHLEKGGFLRDKASLAAGERLRVLAIQKKGRVTVETTEGHVYTLNTEQANHRHLDYGYATTPWGLSKAPIGGVLLMESLSTSPEMTTFLHSAIEHPALARWVYTDKRISWMARLEEGGRETPSRLALLQGKGRHAYVESAIGFVSNFIEEHGKGVGRASATSPEHIAEQAVLYALARLSEHEAAFSHEALLTTALTKALGETTPHYLNAAITQAAKTGALVKGHLSTDGIVWTTKEALAQETRIMEAALNGRGQCPRLATEEQVATYLKAHTLKSEHQSALTALCLSTDRIFVLQGDAGTGKTSLLIHLSNVLQHPEKQNQGPAFELTFLAPTHPAVEEIQKRNLPAQTVERFLVNHRGLLREPEKPSEKRPPARMVVVDEASMLSNRRMDELVQIALKTNSRLLVVGDIRQYAAIEGGKPAALLQQSGITVVHLQDIERQKVDSLKEAVHAIYQRDLKAAFTALAPHVHALPKGETAAYEKRDMTPLVQQLADDMTLGEGREWETKLVVTYTNDARRDVNEARRQRLLERGVIGNNKIGEPKQWTLPILVPHHASHIDKAHPETYEAGMLVRFTQSIPTLRIEAESYWRVGTRHPNTKWVTLQHSEGREIVWNPMRYLQKEAPVELYYEDSRQVTTGDVLRWTRTDIKRNLISPKAVRVMGVIQTPKGLELALQPVALSEAGYEPVGEVLNVPAQNRLFQHVEYAYAHTGYAAQGQTRRSGALLATSQSKMTTAPSFLVGVTRFSHELNLYTDDSEALKARTEEHQGEKKSALEAMWGEGQWLSNLEGKASSPLMAEIPKDVISCQPLAKTKSNTTTKTTPPANVLSPTSHPLLDAKRIDALLKDQTEIVVERLLGAPNAQNGQHMVYGSNQGSLRVSLAGDKRGLWYDFQTGEGGGLLSLIAKVHQKDIQQDYRAILQTAVSLLGTNEEHLHSSPSPAPTLKSSKNRNKRLEEQKIAYAREIARQTIPIQGTLAERYLKEHRGIQLDKWPDSLRFHPKLDSKLNGVAAPALVVIARDAKREIRAIQAIYLHPETGQKDTTLKVVKQTRGVMDKALVNLTSKERHHEKLYIAEGVETGLSLLMAKPHAHIRVSLGKSNFKSVVPHSLSSEVVLCLDNDTYSSKRKPDSPVMCLPEDKAIQKAVHAWQEAGKKVLLIQPDDVKDYNDLLKESGLKAIAKNAERLFPADAVLNATSAHAELKHYTTLPEFQALQKQNIPENAALNSAEQRVALRDASHCQPLKEAANRLGNSHQASTPNEQQIRAYVGQSSSLSTISTKTEPVLPKEKAQVERQLERVKEVEI